MLVGDGGERNGLKGSRKQYHTDHIYRSSQRRRFPPSINAADVLIVNEKPGVIAAAVPSKLTSYFDAARPVVAATDLGGITASEIAAADAGIVVPAGDACALLEKRYFR